MTMLRQDLLFPACLFLAVLLLVGCGGQSNEEKTGQSAAAVSPDSMVIEFNGRDSMTVYELLVASHEVEADTSSMGILVLGIDSVRSSAEAYWIYRVNDSTGMVGCDEYITSDGDRVTWHLVRSGK